MYGHVVITGMIRDSLGHNQSSNSDIEVKLTKKVRQNM